jgi:hypothetical protein
MSSARKGSPADTVSRIVSLLLVSSLFFAFSSCARICIMEFCRALRSTVWIDMFLIAPLLHP